MKNLLIRKLLVVVAALMVAFVGINQAHADDCATLVAEPAHNHFVLVLDRSGSMSGSPIEQARQALLGFVGSTRSGDQVSLVTFASDVTVDARFTAGRSGVEREIRAIRSGGGTHLYDAVAAAVRMLRGVSGYRVIVYLTDGNDGGSLMSVNELSQMNISENTFVYGVGLGNVDHDAIRGLSRSTGGSYHIADSPGELSGLYQRVQAAHYKRADDVLSESAAVTVRSLPSRRPVYVDGERVGRTPVKVDALPAGRHFVEVDFERGRWQCDTTMQAGYRSVINAREADVPIDLVIESAPTRAAAFVDGAYVGVTSMAPSQRQGRRLDYSQQLTIEGIPPGVHTIKLIAAPEFPMGAGGFSSSQIMEFDVTVRDRTVYVKGLIFMNQVEDEQGNSRRVAPYRGSTGSDSDSDSDQTDGTGSGQQPSAPSGSSPFGDSPFGGSGPSGSGAPSGGLPDNFPGSLFGDDE